LTDQASNSPPVVHADSYLTLHYRIVIEDGPAAGSTFINTFDGRPATLQLGSGQWSPSMEAPLIGHPEGDCFSYTLKPQDAYGDRNPDLIQRVSRSMLAEHAGPEATFDPGDMVEFTAPNGGRYSGVLKEFGAESALFDFNHPLAGLTLRVDVDLLGVL
jgi:FKBP-type peptidyl-prolyl cis-trans isomerase SlpA